jgi:hypothetical protein
VVHYETVNPVNPRSGPLASFKLPNVQGAGKLLAASPRRNLTIGKSLFQTELNAFRKIDVVSEAPSYKSTGRGKRSPFALRETLHHRKGITRRKDCPGFPGVLPSVARSTSPPASKTVNQALQNTLGDDIGDALGESVYIDTPVEWATRSTGASSVLRDAIRPVHGRSTGSGCDLILL